MSDKAQGKISVLVLIPMRPTMSFGLQHLAFGLAADLVRSNPDLALVVVFDCQEEPAQPGDQRHWSKVARVRNRMILTHTQWTSYDYILWIDADLVAYPADLPTRFITRNPSAIQAPLVLVENSDRFYDTCAFIIAGQSGVQPDHLPEIPGRNLVHAGPPYWPIEPSEKVVPMDCVGSLVLVPSSVYDVLQYRHALPHTDHPAFTDFFNVCETWRRMGYQVLVDRECIAYHADLPAWGEKWH